MPHDLYSQLHIGEASEGEIEHVLSRHYGGATQAGDAAVQYPSARDEYAIRLIYKNATIIDAQPGPAFTDADLKTLQNRVEADVIADSGELVGQRVLFARVPTKGAFRYRDAFQISPVPDDAPRPPFVIGDHPLSLWCRFRNSPDPFLRISRLQSGVRETELLLSAITSVDIHASGGSARHHWVILPSGSPEPQIGFQQEFYSYPGINAQAPTFPDVISYPELSQVADEEYATRLGISTSQVLDIPQSFENLCDRFYGLDDAYKEAFLTAAFWLQLGNRIHSYSRSAYFTALISSVEALMPDSESAGVCPTCKRSIGKGPTNRFIEFAEQFGAQDSTSRTERRKLYSIRSGLSHGGNLLHSDITQWHAGLSAAKIEEWDNLTTAHQLVRSDVHPA